MRKAEIIFDLEVNPDEVGVTFIESILLSMDCDHCQRVGRSVIFTPDGGAKCFPGSSSSGDRWGGYVEHPPYTGKLIDLEVKKTESGVRATYLIEYQTTKFEDFKYDYREWKGHPNWGRGNFVLDCPECEHAGKHSTQSNLVRPHNVTCKCGYVFYTEKHEMPIIRWSDPDTG